MNPELVLDGIAGAILDGTPIDWPAVEADVTLTDPALVDQLKAIAALRCRLNTSVLSDPLGSWSWGHLEVFERIGHGAYGDVHRAWDTRLDREVALKLLASDEFGDPPSASTAITEGRLMARVRHPNVVTIYGAERIGGRIGLWMEYVKGRTLEEALREGRTFTLADATRLGVSLCNAVAAVHAAGLLHRDIKAQNVMLDDDGRLVLMDFGTGRELDVADLRIAGTPLYLAPEVLAGGASTPQSDVYSIGVVLFRLLTNAYPVVGGNLAELRRAHADGTDARARVDRDEIPARLRRVLARALDPDPERRYRDAGAFAGALADTERRPLLRRAGFAATAAALVIVAIAAWNSTAAKANAPVIAVLPFTNAGSDPGQDDFIDGLTTEVIRNLAAIDGLKVRSQTTSFSFKGKRDLREIANKTKANLMVEATVQRAGGRLRIHAQLVQIPDDVPIWSEKFDSTVEDVFAIQEKISREIVNKLRLTLGSGRRRYQTTTAVYDLYLRARALSDRGGTTNAGEAVRLFERVIAMDPEFAPAHAGLADAYAALSWQLDGASAEEALAAMRPAAMRALELDAQLAEAHAAMGITYARELDWENATKSFEHAMTLNRTLTFSQIPVSYVREALLPLGRAAEGTPLLEAALAADPASLAVQRELGITLYVSGRYDEAMATFRNILAIDPGFTHVNNLLAGALTFSGRPEEAIALYESRPDNRAWERWLMTAYVRTKRQADIERLIAAHHSEAPYRQALIYAALRDNDHTLDALNRAVETTPHRTASVLVMPLMSFLQGDPRLEELRHRLKLR